MTRPVFTRILVFVFAVGLLVAAYDRIDTPGTMTDAARAYLASLTPELKQRTQIAFSSDERENWHFIPLDNRKGVALRDMTPAQKHLAYGLLAAGLSAQGVLKAHTIMSLEQILRDAEKGKGTNERDPEKYYVSIFGEPGERGLWGYRFEGHHISLNFTIINGKVAASSPNFWGSNPAKILDGQRAGLRTLKREEDLAFNLVESLTAEQQKTAIPDKAPPSDIVTNDARKAALKGQATGIQYSKLTGAQKTMLEELVGEFAADFPPVIADYRMAQFKQNQASLYFAWMGGTKRTDPHYYRVQSKAFLIEYDKTQDRGNHIHSVWRDFEGDFGEDTLGQHYQADHK